MAILHRKIVFYYRFLTWLKRLFRRLGRVWSVEMSTWMKKRGEESLIFLLECRESQIWPTVDVFRFGSDAFVLRDEAIRPLWRVESKGDWTQVIQVRMGWMAELGKREPWWRGQSQLLFFSRRIEIFLIFVANCTDWFYVDCVGLPFNPATEPPLLGDQSMLPWFGKLFASYCMVAV